MSRVAGSVLRLLGALLFGAPLFACAQAPVGLSLAEAIRLTLAANPTIRVQSLQVERARGGLQQSAGEFDSVLRVKAGQDRDHTPLNAAGQRAYATTYGASVSALQADTTSLDLALEKPLRNGMVLSTSLSLSRGDGDTNAFQGWAPQNLGTVRFGLAIPLRKGGGEAAAAGETAADLEWQASRQDLRQAVARTVSNTVVAYWRLLAAGKGLAIAREGEASMARMAADTRTLIAADELPAAEINLIQAYLADRRSARVAAEQALLQARQALGAALGLSYRDSAGLTPANDFPPLPEATLPEAAEVLVDRALARRPDLEAARLRRERARILTEAARDQLKPQLDLNLGLGYAGLAEGGGAGRFVGALGGNTTEANAGVGLVYSWAPSNNAARGGLAQRAAAFDQADIEYEELGRSIGLAVDAALAGLARGLEQLRTAEESVAIYRLSLDNERTKNRLGTSTLLNVLSVDDSLRNARLARVNYRLNYLTTLATLNYETGALLGDDPEVQAIDPGRFVGVSWL